MKKKIGYAIRILCLTLSTIFFSSTVAQAAGSVENITEALEFNNNKPAERDVVVVLDRSGSMEGEPIEQTKQAAQQFVDTVMEEDSRISIVSYSDYARVECALTRDETQIKEKIDEIYPDDMTNIYDGMAYADSMLDASEAKKKIIVLMTDGLPNEGETLNGSYQEALVNYAADLKNKGYYIYTLGFFSGVDALDLPEAQQMLADMASPGYHYEVESANDLVFFFDDIANQIGGTQYVYVRIACPVDVSVKCGDEELSSAADTENTRTSFGTLTYEAVEKTDSEEDSGDTGSGYAEEDKVKVLRLKMDQTYDIDIQGYGEGTMDYSISYPNEDGEYDDVREFPGIEVTSDMKATTNTEESNASYLKVDKDGDGNYETTYKTESNGTMKEEKDHTVLFICLGITIAVLLCIIIVLIIVVKKSGKKKEAGGAVVVNRPGVQTGQIVGMFGKYQGRQYGIQTGMVCTVGRSSSCNIQIVDKKVSRVHCTIELLQDGYYQVTERSSNGTFYNDVQLEKGKTYRIPRGALLVIGDADNVLGLE